MIIIDGFGGPFNNALILRVHEITYASKGMVTCKKFLN
jgi:hypothetical protein